MRLRPGRVVLRAAVMAVALPCLVASAQARGDGASVPRSPVPIDFSFAGYEAGRAIPFVKAVLAVSPSGGDDTALIQGALDRVASMPVRADGFRGAVLLASGRFRVMQLHMRVSGVVLRGAGAGRMGP